MVAECLYTLIARFGAGPPTELQSDNGTEFVNNLVKELAEKFNIQSVHGAPYSPNVQGVVERRNLTIGRMFDKYKEVCAAENKPFNWSDNLFISSVCWQYNTSYHSSIKMTPYECHFGRPFNGQYTLDENEQQENYEELREKYQQAAEKAHQETRLKISGTGEPSHKYDVRAEDGKVYPSISVSDIRVRKPVLELKLFQPPK